MNGPPRPRSEHYSLFRSYLDARHADGGMVDMTVGDYAAMVEETYVDTMLVEYRRRGINTFLSGMGDGPLIGAALTDVLIDGLSMVYSYYEPDMQRDGHVFYRSANGVWLTASVPAQYLVFPDTVPAGD